MVVHKASANVTCGLIALSETSEQYRMISLNESSTYCMWCNGLIASLNKGTGLNLSSRFSYLSSAIRINVSSSCLKLKNNGTGSWQDFCFVSVRSRRFDMGEMKGHACKVEVCHSCKVSDISDPIQMFAKTFVIFLLRVRDRSKTRCRITHGIICFWDTLSVF